MTYLFITRERDRRRRERDVRMRDFERSRSLGRRTSMRMRRESQRTGIRIPVCPLQSSARRMMSWLRRVWAEMRDVAGALLVPRCAMSRSPLISSRLILVYEA